MSLHNSKLKGEITQISHARKMRVNRTGPMGFRATHPLFVGNRLQLPEFQRAASKGCQSEKEGIYRQKRGSAETIAQPWGRVLAPPKGT